MAGVEFLAAGLEGAGLPVARLDAVTSGSFSLAGVAALRDGGHVFAKTLTDTDTDFFQSEAAGLSALRELGGVRVPDIVHVSPRLLVLEALRPRGEGERFWERLGRIIAALHTSTVSGRFGWHRDGWHGPGRMRQHNSWETDGHEFYARHRILRWLPEPLVEAEFDRGRRRGRGDRRGRTALAELPQGIGWNELTLGTAWRIFPSRALLARHDGCRRLPDPSMEPATGLLRSSVVSSSAESCRRRRVGALSDGCPFHDHGSLFPL